MRPYKAPDPESLFERLKTEHERVAAVRSNLYDMELLTRGGGIDARVSLLGNGDGSFSLVLRPIDPEFPDHQD